MFSSLLIANRGEIARRVIRTTRRMGIRSIAVYSEADARAPFMREADAACAIGPAPAAQSYLCQERILAAARQSGAEAVHPGYGFLSENADFAQAVRDAGLIWVGPQPDAIRAMGRKDAAKALMQQAGVPVTPGYLGEDQSGPRLAEEAARIGFPLLIKAVAGGGGKGMRRVERADAFADALAACRREALAAFGDDRVLLEIHVGRPRHIEVQVFGDAHGNLVHLFERECSLQRRHQKVVEEAPAPGMTETLRETVCAAALRAARAVRYQGAGTVEFIADASEGLRGDRFWFMEMNTRLQVEHPVTEAITGLDLVEWQLRVAAGEALPLRQDEIRRSGHAIEARLYAENPQTGFLPQTGPVSHFRLAGVRVDSGVEPGGEVSPFYDPLIAKLIAHGPTRMAAAGQLAAACAGAEIWPLQTNAAFLACALRHPEFVAGALDTGFIERHLPDLLDSAPPDAAVLEAAALAQLDPATPSALRGFRLNAPPRLELRLQYGPESLALRVAPDAVARRTALRLGDDIVVFAQGRAFGFQTAAAAAADAGEAPGGAVLAPMPGHILAVAVTAGERVKRGAALLVMEAMKMEMTLAAPCDGRVEELAAAAGARVDEGALLLRLAPGA